MAQANHIFTLLETTSHWDDYVFMDMAAFVLRCLPKPFNAPEQEGYLFVCPPEDFRTGANSFQWPSCPAYWSLDPSGASRLSPEEAKILGFAAIHIETVMRGGSWDGVVYEGLQKFHRGNGFDPYSQDMAIHLGYPLFEFLSEEAAALTYHEVEGWCHLENPALCQALGHCCCE
ncbi:hypothetical protein C8R45DRAFT_493041 [Mycena sanguinolenta]|nr:hypothetical protein C8R45DRAFT_493041 [Mycena sanguinolenta]